MYNRLLINKNKYTFLTLVSIIGYNKKQETKHPNYSKLWFVRFLFPFIMKCPTGPTYYSGIGSKNLRTVPYCTYLIYCIMNRLSSFFLVRTVIKKQ